MEAYHVNEEDRKKIREIFKVTEDEVAIKIQKLKKWVQSLPHLPPETQGEKYLNIMLLRNKFNTDYAKTNIESYFKCMLKYPEIFEKLGKFKPTEEVGVAVATLNMAPNFERIGVLKLCPKNMVQKRFNINRMILVVVTTGVIMYNHDYVASVRFLLDFDGFTMWDLIKVNIKDLFKLVYICDNILRIRISGIELLNAPRMMTSFLAIAKMVLKPKMFARVTAHTDLTSVYDKIPKECLPKDYGGEGESTEKLIELWDQIIETHAPLFQNLANYSKTNHRKST